MPNFARLATMRNFLLVLSLLMLAARAAGQLRP